MSANRLLLKRLPGISEQLFTAKKQKQLTFEQIGEKLGRGDVWVASIFYGQAKPDIKDLDKLSSVLDIPKETLKTELGEDYYPDRCKLLDLPPRDPLIYRLYEVVANFGYSYKAVINEKFGDGIMSAISFSTEVKKVSISRLSRLHPG